jgi:hypothetical protein
MHGKDGNDQHIHAGDNSNNFQAGRDIHYHRHDESEINANTQIAQTSKEVLLYIAYLITGFSGAITALFLYHAGQILVFAKSERITQYTIPYTEPLSRELKSASISSIIFFIFLYISVSIRRKLIR